MMQQLQGKFLFLTVAVATFLNTACEGDKGEPGPQGLQGLQGEKGEPGAPGKVDIIYSDWMALNWNLRNTPGIKEMVIEEPFLTEDFIAEGGFMLAYFRVKKPGSLQIYQLPFFREDEQLTAFMWIYPDILPSVDRAVIIKARSVDNITPVSDFQNDIFNIRYLLIPGTTPVTARKHTIDYSNYEAIKAYYGIPDE